MPREEIPDGREARIEWLFDWWEHIDDWIEANRVETTLSLLSAVERWPTHIRSWPKVAEPPPVADSPGHDSTVPQPRSRGASMW